MHLLFDPLLEAAAALGAGLDWKTSLQELCAEHDLGVPEYVIEDDGPDHVKTFTAQVRVGDRLHGHGVGRSKKEAEQQAAESAYRDHRGTPSCDLAGADADCRCPSSPRSRSSGAAWRPTSSVRTVAAVEVLHPRPVRRHLPGAGGLRRARSTAARRRARRRGKYLWLPLDSGDALLGHLGMSGQLLVQARRARPPSGTCGSGSGSVVGTGRRRELRFVDQRMFGGLSVSPGGADLPAEIAHIARDPLDPEFDEAAFVARVRRSASGDQAASCSNQTVVSGVGNIYADEALWLARVHGDRPGDRLTAAGRRARARPRSAR